MNQKARSHASRAFSLVELLVVVAVIAIVAGFAVPAVTTMLKGSQLTQGSQMVVDQISLARQTALSRNRSVEVRFYKFGDPEIPGEKTDDPTSGFFRAMQVFEVLENGAALPLGPIQRLPMNVIMHEGEPSTKTPLSTIITDQGANGRTRFTKAQVGQDPTAPELPGMPSADKKSYEYVAFRFLPDGSTDLAPTGFKGDPKDTTSDSWYITLVNPKDAKATKLGVNEGEAGNYFTMQIDPITGTTRSYRPNL